MPDTAAELPFVHLRMHTEFSVVDGTLRTDDAASAAAKDGQVAAAITDLANLFGGIKFYSAMRKDRQENLFRQLAKAAATKPVFVSGVAPADFEARMREQGVLFFEDPTRITRALARAFESGNVVFSCGGIGATPDDHTRQCAARALGVALAFSYYDQPVLQDGVQNWGFDSGNGNKNAAIQSWGFQNAVKNGTNQRSSVLGKVDKSKAVSVLYRRGEWAQYALIRPVAAR